MALVKTKRRWTYSLRKVCGGGGGKFGKKKKKPLVSRGNRPRSSGDVQDWAGKEAEGGTERRGTLRNFKPKKKTTAT